MYTVATCVKMGFLHTLGPFTLVSHLKKERLRAVEQNKQTKNTMPKHL